MQLIFLDQLCKLAFSDKTRLKAARPCDQVLLEDAALKGGVEREEQDIEDDPIRRHHFNYTEYSCLVNGHPEIFLDNEGNQVHNFNI